MAEYWWPNTGTAIFLDRIAKFNTRSYKQFSKFNAFSRTMDKHCNNTCIYNNITNLTLLIHVHVVLYCTYVRVVSTPQNSNYLEEGAVHKVFATSRYGVLIFILTLKCFRKSLDQRSQRRSAQLQPYIHTGIYYYIKYYWTKKHWQTIEMMMMMIAQ